MDNTNTDCPRTGEVVTFTRCGQLTRATIIGYDYVTAGLGGSTVRGDELADPRYAARACSNGMAVAVTESEIKHNHA